MTAETSTFVRDVEALSDMLVLLIIERLRVGGLKCNHHCVCLMQWEQTKVLSEATHWDSPLERETLSAVIVVSRLGPRKIVWFLDARWLYLSNCHTAVAFFWPVFTGIKIIWSPSAVSLKVMNVFYPFRVITASFVSLCFFSRHAVYSNVSNVL